MDSYDIKTVRELSDKLEANGLKIPYTTLITILGNHVQDIKLETARRLCTFFHVSLDTLLDDNIPLVDNSRLILNLEGLSDQDIKEIKQIIEIKRMNNKANS